MMIHQNKLIEIGYLDLYWLERTSLIRCALYYTKGKTNNKVPESNACN